MRGLHIAALCAAALLHPIQDSSATSVFRCEDANGQITFTRHGCAPDQTQYRQEVRNHSPGSGKPIPLAVPRARTATPTTRSRAPVIVGEQDDGCGNLLSSSEKRQAIIRREVRSGMSSADVESSLGKPDRITRQNGRQRYHYRDKRGDNQLISFDEAGCVKK
ncbi:hypothetical protein ACF8C1_09495 [Pseudomonas sp. zjy_9]